jgi:ribosomal protein L37AE/L43A
MKITIQRDKKEKPLRKGICPNCFNKMIKRKSGEYHCLKCGNKVTYKK